jgi:NAD(P)-dependent dehydrogenase (short-subunit alcohol dehydrogenase family)
MIEPTQQPLVYATYPDLAGKRVVVTGGGPVGDELVAAFVGQGARVWFFGADEEAGQALAASLAGAVHGPRFIRCEPKDPAALEAAFAAVGDVDILLNNGVAAGGAAFETVSEGMWDDWMAADLRNTFFCCQAVIPGMCAQGRGVILNIGAMPGTAADAPSSLATTADEGLVGLTRSIARDLGGRGVRAAAVLPRVMAMPWDGLPSGAPPAAVGIQDVAALVLFLASSNGRCCRGPD